MNNLFHENKQSFLLLLGLLFLLLLVVFIFFFLPLNKELKSKENDISLVENEVAILNIEIAKLENGTENGVDQFQLAEKLPLDPEMESLILTLQEIEFISNSRLDNISFAYGGGAPQREVIEEENEEVQEEDEETEEIETAIDLENKPENLEVISVSMTVTSPDYEHFQEFMNQIEKQDRLMTVSSLNFQKPAERDLLLAGSSFQTITSSLTITTFYYKDE